MRCRIGWDRDLGPVEDDDSDTVRWYVALRETLEETLEQERVDTRPPDPLYHFQDLCTVRKIVESRQIWAGNVRQMNDSLEIDYAWSQAIRELYSHELSEKIGPEFYDEINPHDDLFSAFVLCLSDPPAGAMPLWRDYGNDGEGLALGFSPNDLLDLERFSDDRPPHRCSCQLVPVVYDPETQTEILTALYDEYLRLLGCRTLSA